MSTTQTGLLLPPALFMKKRTQDVGTILCDVADMLHPLGCVFNYNARNANEYLSKQTEPIDVAGSSTPFFLSFFLSCGAFILGCMKAPQSRIWRVMDTQENSQHL